MAAKLGPHIAFTGNLTIWTTDLDANQAAATLEDRLDGLFSWGLTLSPQLPAPAGITASPRVPAIAGRRFLSSVT